MLNVLEIKQLNKLYAINKTNAHKILDGINLTIKQGEFVCLMGPSGSGKSTLLYNISGMDRPTSGEVLFNRQSLSLLSEKKLAQIRLKSMGFVFQQNFLLKNLTLFDNIALPGYLAKKASRQAIDEWTLQLMEKMDIAELKDNAVTQASGGQLQRAAICRALINRPDIIFADEPTGALNSSSANKVVELLSQINDSGTTIVMASHDVKVAARTERVIYIFDGKIVSEKKLGKKVGDDLTLLKERERFLTDWLIAMGF